MTTTESPSQSVLIAEDDERVRRSVERALRLEGFEVTGASDGEGALETVRRIKPGAVVLDVMMPGIDGLEVCRRLRGLGDRTPILMLTARSAIADRVAGLDAGADDYLVKPFALDELLARLRALLRRADPGSTGVIRVADLEIDPPGRTALRGARPIELTKTEFDLLELLARNVGLVLSREAIYERIWGYDFETTSNPLDVYVGYLRRKLEAEGEPRLVQTVRGIGYVLRES